MKKETITQKMTFGVTVCMGIDCVGCPVPAYFEFTMECTADEIALMRQLVSQASEKKREKGLLAILQSGARKLATRMKTALRQEALVYFVKEGIRHGDIEFDDDELQEHYNQEKAQNEDPEYDYYDWLCDEMARLENESLEYIRSRYSAIDDFDVDDFLDLGYTVEIPKKLLKK